MSNIPWSSGRLLVWDATCSDTFAYSNLYAAVTKAGAVALLEERLKNKKYPHLDSAYIFISVAMKTCSSFRPPNKGFFLKELGRWLASVTLDDNYTNIYYKAMQQGNAASVVGSLPWASKMDDLLYTLYYYLFNYSDILYIIP